MSGPKSFDGATDPVDRVQRGLDLLFAAEVSQELAEAIDVEALRAGAPPDEAVDLAKVGAVLGEPTGRLLVRGALGKATKGGIAGVLVGELAGRAGARALRTALERANTEEFGRVSERAGTESRSSGAPRWMDDAGIGTDVDGSDDPVHIEIESPENDDEEGDSEDDTAAEDGDEASDHDAASDDDA